MFEMRGGDFPSDFGLICMLELCGRHLRRHHGRDILLELHRWHVFRSRALVMHRLHSWLLLSSCWSDELLQLLFWEVFYDYWRFYVFFNLRNRQVFSCRGIYLLQLHCWNVCVDDRAIDMHKLLNGILSGLNRIYILHGMSRGVVLRHYGSLGCDGHLRRWNILHCIIIDVFIVRCRIVFSRCVNIELY